MAGLPIRSATVPLAPPPLMAAAIAASMVASSALASAAPASSAAAPGVLKNIIKKNGMKWGGGREVSSVHCTLLETSKVAKWQCDLVNKSQCTRFSCLTC